MTDQPKPTPLARPQCTELTSEQLLAKLNVENTELTADNTSLLDDSVRIAQERDEATEALEQYALRTNQQIDAITQKLDTFTADNQRLRELLVEWIAVTADYANLELVVVDTGLIERSKDAAGLGA